MTEYEEPSIPMNGEQETEGEDRDWLQIAADAYKNSTSYLDANWRKSVETNMSLFQSKHPPGSKYNSEAYKHRSRLFRPKTRSMVRKNEAATAVAFFSNPDVVTVQAENESNPQQVASAELMQAILNYRLQKTIPWFQTVVGAVQTAQVAGLVCSYQYWHYKEEIEEYEEPYTDELGNPLTDAMGQPVMVKSQEVKIIKDEPCITLLPFENFRFDAGADWIDVVNTSPYFIRLVPMYVTDVMEMMETEDRKTGQPKWKTYSEGQIRQAMGEYDSTRQTRESGRQDPKTDNNAPLSDFEIVWCHENFVRFGSDEYVYWTLGTQHMLTDPVPLGQVYFTGERPFVIGTCVIEAHKAVPDSLVQMGSSLQRETNDTVNQRRDNVSLVLNKRFTVLRGKQVDIGSITRNAAGSVTLVDDHADINPIEFSDVTGSSYQEQDRLNVDYDELTGNFSSSSVMTNRKLNETVGGMSMLSGSSNQMTEYMIRTFVETWVERVLRQLVKLEQAYETDMTILGLAGEKAQLAEKYGVNQVTDEMLNQELTVNVNVGLGATDPQTKLQKFTLAMSTYAQIMSTMPDADPDAVRKELFGLIGYKDGVRFFKGEDPKDQQIQQMQQMLQQMQQQMQGMAQQMQMMEQDKSADMIHKLADADLKDAQVVKTLAEADMVSVPMNQKAVTPYA